MALPPLCAGKTRIFRVDFHGKVGGGGHAGCELILQVTNQIVDGGPGFVDPGPRFVCSCKVARVRCNAPYHPWDDFIACVGRIMVPRCCADFPFCQLSLRQAAKNDSRRKVVSVCYS